MIFLRPEDIPFCAAPSALFFAAAETPALRPGLLSAGASRLRLRR
jgi:hypothetical protein